MSVRAIETTYRGYRFRSRLEARYAVFFDHLGIRWEYEPEGYQLADGRKYLPDFYLPDFEGGCWVEVKPEGGDFRTARDFAREKNTRVWLGEGFPGDKLSVIVHPCGGEWTGVPLASEANGENRMYVCPEPEFGEGGYEEWLMDCGANVLAARNAARSARFEFGENGPPTPPAPTKPRRARPAKRQRARPTTREVVAQLTGQAVTPVATINATAKPRRRGKRPTFTSAEIVALLAGDPLPGRATDTE